MQSKIVLVIVCLASCARLAGQGWTTPLMVNRPDTSEAHMQACMVTDPTGTPWVLWSGGRGDSSLSYSKWLGTRWDTERSLGSDLPDVICRLRPRMAFDENGRIWAVWNNVHTNNANDIGCRSTVGDTWSNEVLVNRPDTTLLHWFPHIACGGGNVWSVWCAGPDAQTLWAIYASRWDEAQRCWSKETQVCPRDSNIVYWFCDVAVDRQGLPHLVWCDDRRFMLYYSHHDGTRWTEPQVINDTHVVWASPWASPHLVVDRNDHLHVSYTGAVTRAQHRDVFYTRYDGVRWSESWKVSQDTGYDEWYSAISATGDSDVWVAFDRQLPPSNPEVFRVFATHFDGTSWSPETRLDNDAAYYDIVPSICQDTQGRPWVTWEAMTYGSARNDIYCSHYRSSAVTEPRPGLPARCGRLRLSVSNPCARTARLRYFLDSPGPIEFRIYSEAGRCVRSVSRPSVPAGQQAFEWDCCSGSGERVAPGIYFCRLKEGGTEETARIVLVEP